MIPLSRAYATALAWDLPADTSTVVGYNIHIATYSLLNATTQQVMADPGVTRISVLGPDTTYYPLSQLGVGTTYYFRATAYNAIGDSAFDPESVDVSTYITLTSIILSPVTGALAPGATQQFQAIALDQSGSSITGVNFAFTSAYSSVAVINGAGLSTGVAAGATLIYASSNAVTGLVVSNPAVLTVYGPVLTSIVLTPAFAAIQPGTTQQFTAVAKDQNGNTMNGVNFTYNTAYSSVAVINGMGLSTGVAAGLTAIAAQSGPITSNTATLSVMAAAPPTVSIVAPPNSANVSGIITVLGTASAGLGLSNVQIQVDAGSFNLASGTAAWSYSLDTTKVANGAHTITARATDLGSNPVSVAISVTVSNPVLSAIVLIPANVAVHVGQTQQFAAMAKDQNGNTMNGVGFAFSSLYSTVAVINGAGLAIGVAPGLDVIAASSNAVTGLVTSNPANLTVSADIADSVNDMQISNNPIRPARGITNTTFSHLPPNTRLRIYTLTGRLVKDITVDAAGVAIWDATTASGSPAVSGVYFIFAQGNGTTRTFKIAVQR